MSIVSIFFDISMTTANLIGVARPISTFLTQFYIVPLFTSSSSKTLLICTFHKHSGLVLYQIILFLDLLEKRTISDGGSNDISLHHIVSQPGTSSVLSNRCEFTSLCLTERKPRGGKEDCTSYSYNLNVEMNSHDSQILQH